MVGKTQVAMMLPATAKRSGAVPTAAALASARGDAGGGPAVFRAVLRRQESLGLVRCRAESLPLDTRGDTFAPMPLPPVPSPPYMCACENHSQDI